MASYRWDKSTMPRPIVAWSAMAASLAISAAVMIVGALRGFGSTVFLEAQALGRLPAIAIAGLVVYVSAKSNRKVLLSQQRFRIFGLLTIAAGLVFAI